MQCQVKFLSTLSLRRATGSNQSGEDANNDFYPRSPCGERLWANFSGFYWWVISIHALLAESDSERTDRTRIQCYFYPRSPCGERLGSVLKLQCILDFYPRSPCGERLFSPFRVFFDCIFLSTLSLRRATFPLFGVFLTCIFLSTLSLRRATGCGQYCTHAREISIHALLAESDLGKINTRGSEKIFLSTLSLRRATHQQGCHQDYQKFLSTLSLRRAT